MADPIIALVARKTTSEKTARLSQMQSTVNGQLELVTGCVKKTIRARRRVCQDGYQHVQDPEGEEVDHGLEPGDNIGWNFF